MNTCSTSRIRTVGAVFALMGALVIAGTSQTFGESFTVDMGTINEDEAIVTLTMGVPLDDFPAFDEQGALDMMEANPDWMESNLLSITFDDRAPADVVSYSQYEARMMAADKAYLKAADKMARMVKQDRYGQVKATMRGVAKAGRQQVIWLQNHEPDPCYKQEWDMNLQYAKVHAAQWARAVDAWETKDWRDGAKAIKRAGANYDAWNKWFNDVPLAGCYA